MLQLLYTNSPAFNQPQPVSALSHGGWISSSEVPNAYLGNIFGDISLYTIQQNLPEIRAIAVKNIGLSTKINVIAYVQYPDNNDCIIKLGVSDPSADDCGDLYAPKIASIYAAPYGVELVEANEFVNAISIGDIDPGSYFILYIQRILKPELQVPKSDEDLLAIFDGTELPTLEDITLKIEWDD